MNIDETMSQDTAFEISNAKPDTFNFDSEEKSSAPQAETESKENTSTQSEVSKEENDSVTSQEENKVPYSRFKKKVDEVNEYSNKIAYLEGQLEALKSRPQESTSHEDVDVPAEWKELYGDSEVSKRAFKIQLEREAQIRESAVEQAIETLTRRQQEEISSQSHNEEIIDNSLEQLQESIGKKLTEKQEEDILTIVDEFSPVGEDGKYISLFPFDKAYEIYTLRNAQKGQATKQARQSVADLTGNTSEGEVDSTVTPFRRGWDNWREEL